MKLLWALKDIYLLKAHRFTFIVGWEIMSRFRIRTSGNAIKFSDGNYATHQGGREDFLRRNYKINAPWQLTRFKKPNF